MQRQCELLLWAFVAFFVVGTAQVNAQPAFELGFSDAPELFEGPAGAEVEHEVTGTLASSGIDTPDGAQAWQIGIRVGGDSIGGSGCDLLSATTLGTAGALPGDGGIRDPLGSFEKTEIIPFNDANNGWLGLVSAVIISFEGENGAPVTLPPEGVSDIVKFTISSSFPNPVDGECVPNACELAYIDGLIGGGEAIENKVTYRGENVIPTRGVTTINFCAFQGDFALGFDVDGGVDNNGTTTFEGLAGTVVEFGVNSTLTSDKDDNGAQGWQTSFRSTGDCDLLDASFDGTAGDFTTNGGYSVVGNSFQDVQFDVDFVDGTFSQLFAQAVVLDFNSQTTLPPQGSQDLLRMQYSSAVNGSNADGSCNVAPCIFEYRNDLPSGIENAITFRGADNAPSLLNRTVEVCPFQGDFTLGWDAPTFVEGQAGTEVSFEAYATLQTGTTPTDRGAQGWQIAGRITGDWNLDAITIDGTAAAFQPDGFRVVGNSFEKSELIMGTTGLVPDEFTSSVVLDFNSETFLPLSGTERLLGLSLSGPVPLPVDGVCIPNPCRLDYVNGINDVNNVITYDGSGNAPALLSHQADVCNFQGEFALSFDAPERLEGLAGSVFAFNVNSQLTTGNLPTDEGVQGWQIRIAVDGWDVDTAVLGSDAADTIVPGNSFVDTKIIPGTTRLVPDIVENAVVLDFGAQATLPTSGTANLLQLGLSGEVPSSAPGGVCEPNVCSLSYADNGIQNLVTYEGANAAPSQESASTEICPFSGEFDLGFDAPARLEGLAGSTFSFNTNATLESSNLPTDNGAQGWEIRVAVDGWDVDAAALGEDAAAASVPGNSFVDIKIIPGSTRLVPDIVENAVVLDFGAVSTLPTTGTATLLEMTLSGGVPSSAPEGICEPNVCSLSYATDGRPNLITYEGASNLPSLDSASTEICAFSPDFALGFDAPGGVVGPEGGVATFDALAVLSSTGIDGDDGAQGWQIAIAGEGCAVASASLAGTDAGAIIVPGNSFQDTAVVDGGVRSAVVLDLSSGVTLAPNATSSILSMSVEAPVPDAVDFRCSPSLCGLTYENSEGVTNLITFRGSSVAPMLGSGVVEICPDLPAQATFRVDLADGQTGDKEGSRAAWSIDSNTGGVVDAEALIYLESAVEPCVSDPERCAGGENFEQDGTFGCSDGIDNDGDELVDIEDPDCTGIQGWSLSVKTAPCFNVSGATTAGTVADLDVNGGLRPPGSFEKTELVDPADNDGMEGAVSAVVLSIEAPITLPPVDDGSLVLRVMGSLDATSVPPGGMTDPCDVDVVDPSEEGLVGSGLAVKTTVTIDGESFAPAICNASFKVNVVEAPPAAEFIRCDPNDDGISNIADAIWIVNELFQEGPRANCQKSSDCNDDSTVDVSDASYSIAYRFMDGAAPPAPFPDCGEDPTEDALTCDSSASCP